jgi:Tfp pilus assembly protein PilN
VRPVNLIPPEDRRGDRAPMRAGPLAYVLVGVLLLAFVGVYLTVTTGNDISEKKAEVASLEDELESSQARADALTSYTSFATLEQARTQTITALARSRFDWERVMRELALVIPEDVSLTLLTGAVSSAAASGAGSDSGSSATEAINSPTLTMTGCATGHESVAAFVASLRDIDGVTRVGLASSTQGSVDGSAEGSTASSETGISCPDPNDATFKITVAFDEVVVDSAGGTIAPPPAPEPTEGDGSGVAEAEAEHSEAQDSVEDAKGESQDAVNDYVPGA